MCPTLSCIGWQDIPPHATYCSALRHPGQKRHVHVLVTTIPFRDNTMVTLCFLFLSVQGNAPPNALLK